MKRHIEPKMVAYLDSKLEHNGMAQEAIKNKEARMVFVFAVEACVGIREVGGNNHGPLVELIQETVGRAEGEAWCMAFIQTCIAYAEVKTGIQSRFPVTEHCYTAWQSCPEELKVLFFPKRGAIAIWKYYGSDSGHTGMFEEGDQYTFKAVEGNTEKGVSPTGKVETDGGGVYNTQRSMNGDGSKKLLGFLKPF